MKWLTGFEAAAMLGISRRTLYRWHHEGRLPQWQWTTEHITARRAQLLPRRRGPTRNPDSKRYTIGRHSFDRSNSQCNH